MLPSLMYDSEHLQNATSVVLKRYSVVSSYFAITFPAYQRWIFTEAICNEITRIHLAFTGLLVTFYVTICQYHDPGLQLPSIRGRRSICHSETSTKTHIFTEHSTSVFEPSTIYPSSQRLHKTASLTQYANSISNKVCYLLDQSNSRAQAKVRVHSHVLDAAK